MVVIFCLSDTTELVQKWKQLLIFSPIKSDSKKSLLKKTELLTLNFHPTCLGVFHHFSLQDLSHLFGIHSFHRPVPNWCLLDLGSTEFF